MALGVLVQGRRDKAAARRFIRRLLKTTCTPPRTVATDKLRSYGAAHGEDMPFAGTWDQITSAADRPHHDLNAGPDRRAPPCHDAPSGTCKPTT